MGLGNITFGGNNVRFGNDADKPVSPNPADEYIAIDTGKKYVCYTKGEWENITPETLVNSSGVVYFNSLGTTEFQVITSPTSLSSSGDPPYTSLWNTTIKTDTPDGKLKLEVRLKTVGGGSEFWFKWVLNGVDVGNVMFINNDTAEDKLFTNTLNVQEGDILELFGKADNRGTTQTCTCEHIKVLVTPKNDTIL